MEAETLTDVQECELKAGVAEVVNNVGEWMRFLLNSARAASCKARVIKFRPIVSSTCNFSDENSFRFCDGITDPVSFSTLAEFSWMISSDKIVLPQTYEEEWNACCIALGSYLALEIRTSTIYPISGEINAQPLDVVLIAGGKCSSAGRLELQVDGKFDRFVYCSLESLDVCSIVLPPDVMMRNCLPNSLGNDVIQVILQFVGSPFAQAPPISIKTSDDIVLCHDDEGPSISYIRDILGAQILSVSSCLSPQSMYSRFRDYVKYECSWYGNGRTAKVKKTQLRRTNDCYYDGFDSNYEDNYDGPYDGNYEDDYDGYYDGYDGLDEG